MCETPMWKRTVSVNPPKTLERMQHKLQLTIPKSADASDGAITSRQYISDGDGFTLIFTLPFKCEDVYRELISEKQLRHCLYRVQYITHCTFFVKFVQASLTLSLELLFSSTEFQ